MKKWWRTAWPLMIYSSHIFFAACLSSSKIPFPMLTISITRISPTHHRFSYVRDDGTGESADLETKSFLMHDFIHFCVEDEGKLSDGFYGLLESGRTYTSLTPEAGANVTSSIAMEIEQIVGVMTGVVKGVATPEDAYAGVQNLFDAYGKPIPDWFTLDLIARAKARYQKVTGEFNSLKFGETLTLIFNRHS